MLGALIYVAGRLFSAAERRFNLGLTHTLEALGFDVFLPRRDGVERDGPPRDTMTPRSGVSPCSTSTGPGSSTQRSSCSCSTGASLTKYLQNGEKLLVGLHTDTRAAFIGGRLNPKVLVTLDYVVDDEEKLMRVLAGYGSGVEAGTE